MSLMARVVASYHCDPMQFSAGGRDDRILLMEKIHVPWGPEGMFNTSICSGLQEEDSASKGAQMVPRHIV